MHASSILDAGEHGRIRTNSWYLRSLAFVRVRTTTALVSAFVLICLVVMLAMGLAISSSSSSPDRAISVVPLALIPQILFAGVIFSLGDGLTIQRLLSWFTISRWAMDAYGTTVNLNDLPFQPGMLRVPKDEYTFTATHLVSRWLILLAYMVVCLGITAWQLKRRDRQI